MPPKSQSWNLFDTMMFMITLLVISSKVTASHFLVKTLPGLHGDLPFTLETGYVGVGESEDVQLFYYFTQSERNPEDDPLMLWLTGGPGCSGLSGLLYEIGPFAFDYANSTLEKPILEVNPYSWTKVANIIFVDQPVGTGFSYAKTSDAYMMNDTLSAMETYDFLRKWLMDHPKFLRNPLYIGGDSYCGIVVPMIVEEIYKGNEVGKGPKMNIKGYLLGNPVTDMSNVFNSRIRFAHRMGLISDALYKSAKESCHEEYSEVDPDNVVCANDLRVVEKCLERINLWHVLEPVCVSTNSVSNRLRRDLSSLERTELQPRFQKQWCREDNYMFSVRWANSRDVQDALHVRKGFKNNEWLRCNGSLKVETGREAATTTTYTPNIQSSVDYHRRIADRDCRVLIYSGDHDLTVPYLNTLDWIESLNLTIVIDWTPWFVKGQAVGYTMKYSKGSYKLTFATVKGGGHTATEYRPEQCLRMVARWFADDTL